MFIRELVFSAVCAAIYISYLAVEYHIITHRARRIPIRIGITGTRGKSSVTRLIASVLREAGFSVLAKTTGSIPVVILPNGQEKEIKRRGVPSILEDKKILKAGAKLGVQVLVSELMGIHPERVHVESTRMLRPHIIVITNVRLDHMSQMGYSRESIASCFAGSIPERSTVFVLEEEFFPVFKKAAEGMGSRMIVVPKGTFDDFLAKGIKLPGYEFQENMRLAMAVSGFLGINKEMALNGMSAARQDFGGLKIWRFKPGASFRPWYFVSGFAANDPESSRLVIENIKKIKIFAGKKIIGLLNLRKDRGDRSLQWLRALKEGAFPEFSRLIIIGEHASILKRKLESKIGAEISAIKSKSPEDIMNRILELENEESILIGLGNIGEAGRLLVNYLEQEGQPYVF
ncbi:MAG: poly-gamma-glutamate synthase PgsB [Acidobacteriota bacterium]|nr:poly-gamma-glutamate synthase PgsB [Acidobacteriota bacterium]